MRKFVTIAETFKQKEKTMRKFVAIAALALTVSAWLAIPARTVMAAAPAPAPGPDCLGQYLTCAAAALQDLVCCSDPKAKDCIKVFTPDLTKPLTCRAEFRDQLGECDDAFFMCLLPSAKM
jgi:hypothetical protein